MATVTWLHLSDLHICRPRTAWDAERVTETLVKDLRRLQHKHGLRPDLIFFTGDAAFGEIGTEREKTVAGQLAHFADFVTAVRQAFEPEIPLADTFLVPGNHDVNREQVSDDQTEWLDRQKALEPVVQMVQKNKAQWRHYRERLDDYRAFLEQHGFAHLLAHADHLIHANLREVNGWRVGIAGFNTAWSCCRSPERGRLWMAGAWQQGLLRPVLRDTDFSIALMHHPPDWLVEWETPHFGRGLEQDFRFLLHGHDHRDWVLQNAEDYSVIAAAACYASSESEHNGYNLVRLDPERGSGEVWLRRYDSAGGGWVRRVVANDKTDGRGVWPLRLDWLAQQWQERSASGRVVDDPAAPEARAESAAIPAAEADPSSELGQYLERLHAAHRDLPLAGFETRVRLPIRIEEVFMPLRARLRHHALEREQPIFGASRELDATCDGEREVPFDESLTLARQHGLRGVVVLGDPGSGKTTLLKHFILAATDPLIGPAALGLPAATVPVLIELRSLQEPEAGLKAAIQVAIERVDIALEGRGAARFTRALLRKKPLLILVDGLDEVADEKERALVSRWLERGLHQLPESTFVVTSRYAGYQDDARLSGRFLELHVQDVEPAEARAFIDAWYRAVESQAELGRDAEVAARLAREGADDLAAKIFVDQDARTLSLRQLARNPLMLQILCLVHRDRKRLPERRVELYRECVLVLLELWRRAKDLPLVFDAPQAQRLLQPLAYALHQREDREAELDELLPHLEAPLRELRHDPIDGVRLLAAIRDQSGVLVSLGGSKFGFLHLSFQEYLTALHVQDRSVREPAVLQELAAHFGQPWWREVILLSLGLNNPALFEPLLDAILEQGLLHCDVALADDCLRDSLTTSARPFLKHLEKGIEDAVERYHALRLLRELPDWKTLKIAGRSSEAWLRQLARQDPDPQVRGMAGELVGLEVEGRKRPAAAVRDEGFAERRHEKDGSVLVYVPGGEFTLGSGDGRYSVRLSPFWIGKYPVTNAQYRRFLEAHSGLSEPAYWKDKRFNHPQQPVVGVSWLDAMAYCEWAELSLPTEAQWEAAARGTDARKYPWGDEPPSSELAVYDSRSPAPVGSCPKGAGPYGTLDQAGNVWEWCRDGFDPKAYQHRDGQLDPWVPGEDDQDRGAVRVLRGGGWAHPALHLPSALRSRFPAGIRDLDVGFRVVSGFGPEHGS